MRGDLPVNAVLSILMLAAIALVAGAIVLWRRPGFRKQAVLMLVLAAVALVNVGIWTMPDASGNATLAQVQDRVLNYAGNSHRLEPVKTPPVAAPLPPVSGAYK